MPMYFPDLESVQSLAKSMAKNKGAKQYRGIYPKNKNELSEARQQLAWYMREIWKDELFALEIELAVTKENYDAKIGVHIETMIKGTPESAKEILKKINQRSTIMK